MFEFTNDIFLKLVAVMMVHVSLQTNTATSERIARTDQMKNHVQQHVTSKRTSATGGITSLVITSTGLEILGGPQPHTLDLQLTTR